MATKKYLSLERLNEYDTLLKSEIAEGDDATLSSAKSYTNTEVAKKADKTHNHDTAYDAKGAASAAQTAAQSYTDTKISGLTSGTTVVKNAEHATTADTATSATTANSATTAGSATKATQDGNGKVISEQYETKADASSKLATAKSYTDSEIAKLLDNSSEAVDSIYELRDAMEDNADAISALQSIAGGKADKTHTHAISDVTNLQTTLNAKAAQSSLDSHTGNTTVHITSTERTNWNAAKSHADSAHAPSNAEKNQNAFSNVKVGTTTVAADSTTDTLELVGSNVTLTPDATNDKVTIGITKANVTTALGYTPPTTNTTYNPATQSAQGLMSADDKKKLDGIATGATKVTVDSALSTSSTNPVQNKVINTALSNLTTAVSANTSSISALQASVNDFEEITAAEISALFN